MLKYNPKERSSAENCLTHKWFKKFESAGTKVSALNSNTISNIKKFHVNYLFEFRMKTNSNKLLCLIL